MDQRENALIKMSSGKNQSSFLKVAVANSAKKQLKSSSATTSATFSQKYRRYRYRYCKSSAATVAVARRYRY